MILHALNSFYERLLADPQQQLPQYGFSVQKVGFCVVLNSDGSLHGFQPVVSEVIKGRSIPEQMIVPGQAKPSGSGINPGLLWDNATYMLGAPHPVHDAAWAEARFEAFRQRHLDAEKAIGDDSFSAVCRFLEQWSPQRVDEYPSLAEMSQNFGVFQIRAQAGYIHERPAVGKWWQKQLDCSDDGPMGICLVEGRELPIARLHEPKIKGVTGAQSMGATLVAFNLEASESYRKTQAFNAPVSQQAAFQYTTALNHLLDDKEHRVQIGDTTVVFWTEQPTEAEFFLGSTLSDLPVAAEDEELKARIQSFLQRLRQGKLDSLVSELENPETPFYILGLAPNASRLSVRFWHESTVGEMCRMMLDHHQNLEVVGLDSSPTLGQLVRETAAPSKGWPDDKSIPQTLIADLAYAVLTGGPYPPAFYQAVLRRIGAEKFATADKRKDWQAAMARRAAAVKACLNRNFRKEMPVSLDINRLEPEYHFGRWFALLEKTQREALPGLNDTIKDRYYTAASSTPAVIMPRLISLHQHHLNKLKEGHKINREKLAQEIAGKINGFSRYLSFEQQGLFHLGYYHQMQDFFTRKADGDGDAEAAAAAE